MKIWENYIRELYDRANRPEYIEVEIKKEVDEDKKTFIFCTVEKALKEMSAKKDTGNNDLPGHVVKFFG